jgi:transcriptional regulator with XRE-family HTH domain
MVTPRELRAARAFLGWSRQRLADKAVVSLNSVVRLEQGAVDPRTSTLNSVRQTLERAGIVFLSLSGPEEGIKLRLRAGRSKGRRPFAGPPDTGR